MTNYRKANTLLTPPAWTTRAACTPDNAHLFIPTGREGPHQQAAREHAARTICSTCPARPACLTYALTLYRPEGIWAGHTEPELRAIRRAQRKKDTVNQPAQDGAA